MMRRIFRCLPLVLLVVGLLATPASAAAPANDAFVNRHVVALGDLPFTQNVNASEATLQSGEPFGTCAPTEATVWYEFDPPVNAAVRVDTEGSAFDTVIELYTGLSLDDLKSVTCNDDIVGGTSSLVEFTADADEKYFIQVGAANGATPGTLSLQVARQPHTNDDFEDAIDVTSLMSFDAVTNNIGATFETLDGEPTGQSGDCRGNMQRTLWYTFVPDSSEVVQIDTLGSDPDNVNAIVAVYDSSSFTPGLEDLREQYCNDNQTIDPSSGNELNSAIRFKPTPDERYYVQIGGSAGDLTVHIGTPTHFPANDGPPGTQITSVPATITQDTLPALPGFGGWENNFEYSDCDGSDPGRSVWFRYVAQRSGVLVADTHGSNFDTVLAADTDRGPGTICSDDRGSEDTSEIAFTVSQGSAYRFQVGGAGGEGGQLSFHLRYKRGPSNDDESNPRNASLPFTHTVDVTGASWSGMGSDVCEGLPLDHDVWYAFKPKKTALVTAAATSDDFDGFARIWAPGDDGTYEVLADSCGAPSTSFTADAGTVYLIQAGALSSHGMLTFELKRSYRPDILVGTPDGSSMRGDDTYSDKGKGQKISLNAGVGDVNTFDIEVQNDGGQPDNIVIKGPGDIGGFDVQYFWGSTDMTSQITSPSGWTVFFTPGATREIQMRIAAGAEGKATWPVSVASAVDATTTPDVALVSMKAS